MATLTMVDVAGDAIEAACRLEGAPPTAIVVLWAFSLGSAMMLYRDGFACRASADEWAMHEATVDQMWPQIEEGLERYMRTCSDITIPALPTKEEFFLETVPGSLGLLSDVRLVRTQDYEDILAVLTEKHGENFLNLDHSEMRLMIYVAKRLFNTVGLAPYDPSDPTLS
jgi:hypothetical protein